MHFEHASLPNDTDNDLPITLAVLIPIDKVDMTELARVGHTVGDHERLGRAEKRAPQVRVTVEDGRGISWEVGMFGAVVNKELHVFGTGIAVLSTLFELPWDHLVEQTVKVCLEEFLPLPIGVMDVLLEHDGACGVRGLHTDDAVTDAALRNDVDDIGLDVVIAWLAGARVYDDGILVDSHRSSLLHDVRASTAKSSEHLVKYREWVIGCNDPGGAARGVRTPHDGVIDILT
jgi:hypothetical protein